MLGTSAKQQNKSERILRRTLGTNYRFVVVVWGGSTYRLILGLEVAQWINSFKIGKKESTIPQMKTFEIRAWLLMSWYKWYKCDRLSFWRSSWGSIMYSISSSELSFSAKILRPALCETLRPQLWVASSAWCLVIHYGMNPSKEREISTSKRKIGHVAKKLFFHSVTKAKTSGWLDLSV